MVAALQAFYDCTGGAKAWKANNWPSREQAGRGQEAGTDDDENFDDEEFDDDDDETQEEDQNRSTAVEAAVSAAAEASASAIAAAQHRIESTSLVGVPDFHECVHRSFSCARFVSLRLWCRRFTLVWSCVQVDWSKRWPTEAYHQRR